MQSLQATLRPGDRAPDFTLKSLDGDRPVSLADYRGNSALLLALFRGLWCPFCRRAIVQMAASSQKLKPLGIESLAVVATDPENARLYYKFRPTKLSIAVDPDLSTHQLYGVPVFEPTPEVMQDLESVHVNPTGELPHPMPLPEAGKALDELEGYQSTESDQRDSERQWTQLMGQFLIDRDGLVRWVNIEGADEGLAGAGKFPTYEQLLAAAQTSVAL